MTDIWYPNMYDVLISSYAVMMTIAGIILCFLTIAGWWKMLEKAGEPGWTSIIPILNTYKLFKISWGCGWFFLLGFIPIINIVIDIMLAIKIAHSFGKGGGYAVGLFFLPSIFCMILGFGDAVYYGPDNR